jgi:hypothetical protein
MQNHSSEAFLRKLGISAMPLLMLQLKKHVIFAVYITILGKQPWKSYGLQNLGGNGK